jgi:hypothetical protein
MNTSFQIYSFINLEHTAIIPSTYFVEVAVSWQRDSIEYFRMCSYRAVSYRVSVRKNNKLQLSATHNEHIPYEE